MDTRLFPIRDFYFLYYSCEYYQLHPSKIFESCKNQFHLLFENYSDFLFSITKQWKASPKSSIVKSPQRNNQTGSTFPLPMKRIPLLTVYDKRKILNSVSFLIWTRVLLSHTGHRISCKNFWNSNWYFCDRSERFFME